MKRCCRIGLHRIAELEGNQRNNASALPDEIEVKDAEIASLRAALHEIDIEASNTIPPDGKVAAFAALDRIMRLINPFRRPSPLPVPFAGRRVVSDLEKLAAAVERLKSSDNSIDVLIEIALFKPDAFWESVRANAAGTKVIYTTVSGRRETFLAQEWTGSNRRADTVSLLRTPIPSSRREGGSA